jgi:ethanolamine utilization protein EutN
MIFAEVIGTVVTPVQHPSLDGKKLLYLRGLDPQGASTGKAFIGVDGCGAGHGDRVIVIDEGNSGRQLTGIKDAPIKTVVVGVVDFIEGADGQLLYNEATS